MQTLGVSFAALVAVATFTATSYSQTDAVPTSAPRPDAVLWNPAGTAVSKTLPESDVQPYGIRFDTTGKLLALNCDGAFIVWSLPDGRESRRFPSSNLYCNPAWSPRSNELAISDTSKSVSVHSVVDGSLRFRIPNLPSDVLRLEWSPCGDFLAIGGWDGMLRICNVSERAITKTLDVGSDAVASLAYSSSGDRLAIRTQGELVLFWNPSTDVFTNRQEIKMLNGSRSIAYGTTKYALTIDGGISVFDSRTDTIAYTVPSHFASSISFAADEAFLVFEEWGGYVVLVGPNGQRLHEFRCTTGYVRSMSLSPDSNRLAVVDSNSQVVVWDVSSIAMLKAATRTKLPSKVTLNERYSDLLQIFSAPNDQLAFGDFFEMGVVPGSSEIRNSYWVYSAPNWYVFKQSKIGMHHPRSPLPQPVDVPGGKRRLWLAFPNAICRRSFADAVAGLPESIREIEAASLTYQHGFTFAEKNKNHAVAILTLDVISDVDTAKILEALATRASIIIRDGTVLTETEAKHSSLFPQEPPERTH